MAPWKRCETLGPMNILPGQLDDRRTASRPVAVIVAATQTRGHPMRVTTNVAGSGTIHRG
jgi:hypothetical protein